MAFQTQLLCQPSDRLYETMTLAVSVVGCWLLLVCVVGCRLSVGCCPVCVSCGAATFGLLCVYLLRSCRKIPQAVDSRTLIRST